MKQLHFRKTRIAPTPSGYLHIGNALSFLLTSALAQDAGAKVLLRIDDMDKARVRKEYVEDIFETLRFLQINWSKGPKNYPDYEHHYSQKHRLLLYENALQQLRDDNKVFACTCTRKTLLVQTCHCFENKVSLDTPGVSWKLITDLYLPLTVKMMNGEKFCSTLPSSMQSFVVRRKDGFASYHLTSLMDDEHFGVDAIVRGNDLWDSTLAQQYLALVLGKSFFQDALFYHHPLITDENGKLSKSAGAASLLHLRAAGAGKEQIIGLLERAIPDEEVKDLLQKLK